MAGRCHAAAWYWADEAKYCVRKKYGALKLYMYLMCVQEFSEQRFFAFISLCAD